MKRLILLCSILFSLQMFPQGGTWTTFSNTGITTALQSVSPLMNGIVWAGGDNGVVLRTINNGVTWTNVGGGILGTNTVYNVCAIDQNTCLVTTSLSSTSSDTWVFKTTNGGATWTQVFNQPSGFIDCIEMVPNSQTDGFMYGDPVGSRWSLWHTSDAGSTWDSTGLYLPQSGTEAGWNNAMTLSYNGGLWFGTNNTRIYYNNGTGWSIQPTTGTENVYSIWMTYNYLHVGYAGASALVKTTNNGLNWNLVSNLPGTENICGILGGGPFLWVARQGTSIYYTNNSGSTWATAYTIPSGVIYHLKEIKPPAMDVSTVAWAVTSTGLVLRGENLPVPVELTSFTAAAKGTMVNLNWSTATELNNHGFELLRKDAGSDYKVVTFIDGQGTTTEKHYYNYNERVASGKYYYKLRQIDFDGTMKEFTPIEVEVSGDFSYSLDQNYPNPFNPSTSIRFTIPQAGLTKLTIYNLLGQQVKSLVNEFKEAGSYSINFNATDLPSGAYFYKLESPEFSKTMKMLLSK